MGIIKTALAVLLLAPILSAQTIQLDDGAFKVAGLKPELLRPAADFSSIFAVYTGGADAPAVMGSYSVEGDSLVFRPRFPLAPGVRYRAVLQPAGSPLVEAIFDGPKKETVSSTRVVHIYPSTNVVPINQLKLYIHFSAPMSRGEAWRRIHLLDGNGQRVELPFVEIEQELWDNTYQRLTVLFDPGRIKRGLVPTNEVGPPLEDGKQYTLVIDRDYLDAQGVPLVEEFRKPFRGAPADRTPIDPKQWRVSAPKAGTLDSLIVDFPEPMDYALLQRTLTVLNFAGTVSVDREETQWRFTPVEPWAPVEYQLMIDSALEDLAGNRTGRTFDVDTFQDGPARAFNPTVSLSFRVSR